MIEQVSTIERGFNVESDISLSAFPKKIIIPDSERFTSSQNLSLNFIIEIQNIALTGDIVVKGMSTVNRNDFFTIVSENSKTYVTYNADGKLYINGRVTGTHNLDFSSPGDIEIVSGGYTISQVSFVDKVQTADEIISLVRLGGLLPKVLHPYCVAHLPLTQPLLQLSDKGNALASVTNLAQVVAHYKMDTVAKNTSNSQNFLFDYSGNENHLLGSIRGFTPNGINGFNYIDFISGDSATISAFKQGVIPHPYTVILVARLKNTTNGFTQVFSSGDNRTDVFLFIRYSFTHQLNAGVPLDISQPPSTTEFMIIQADFDGPNSAFYYNNALDSSGDTGTNGLDGITLSRANANPDVAECLILSYKPDETERTAIYNELKAKYNL